MSQETKHQELLQEQIERRQRRATAEIARIVNKGPDPVYSLFEVRSASGRSYGVRIRSLVDLRNSCTCPDYRTNTIGTCKHIEGVLIHLRKAYQKEWDDLIHKAPSGVQVFVHHGENTTVRATLPLPQNGHLADLLKRYFDPEGVLQGSLLQALPAFLLELKSLHPKDQQTILVDQEVHDLLKNVQDRDAVEEQKRWFLDQVKQGNRSLNPLSSPLYAYQEQGVLHLSFGRRVILADDMGLGKTVQAIGAVALLKELRDIQTVLVVTPASLKHQWAREIQRFTSLPVQVIEGNPILRRDLYQKPKVFNIITYELVRHDEKEIARHHFDLVILDEAQRIKNWRTKTADCVKRLRSTYAFVLTGTPLENRLDELYSIFQFIDPTILGPLWRFNETYFAGHWRPTGSYKVEGYQNLDQLRRTIKPYLLRRVRDQVLLDLPERIDNHFFVDMTPPQIDAYLEYEHTVARLMALAKRRALSPEEHKILLGALIKMRLICNALALHDPDIKPKDREKTSPKLRELGTILSEQIQGNGHKALVFSQWSTMLNFTEPILERLGLGWVKLTGAVPSQKRGALVDRFFEDPECKVFLSTDAGGVGLNLQAASMVINLELPWNPAVLEQRIGRAHRHGQRNPVHVLNLIAKGTIEERILDNLGAKMAIFDAALNEESTVSTLSFGETKQGILQTLEVLLGTRQVEAQVDLKPAPATTPTLESPESAAAAPAPGLKGLADLLAGRFPGRILLVRRPPGPASGSGDDQVLVVVDRDPAALRPEIERLCAALFENHSVPRVLLMEEEGYRALALLLGEAPGQIAETRPLYQAPSLAEPRVSEEEAKRQKRVKACLSCLDQGERRLRLASVVLEGGFPEEVLAPLRQALAWALHGLLSLVRDHTPEEALPSSRLVEAELVSQGHIPLDLAARLDRVRTLTTPPTQGEADLPPPSPEAAQSLMETLQDALDKGRELSATIRK